LKDLALKFEANCLCEKAVECWIKIGDLKRAVDCCVLLKNWTMAMELAEKLYINRGFIIIICIDINIIEKKIRSSRII